MANPKNLLLCLVNIAIASDVGCFMGGVKQNALIPGTDCVIELYQGTIKEAIRACSLLNGKPPIIRTDSEDYSVWTSRDQTYFSFYDSHDSAEVWLGWRDDAWIDKSPITFCNYYGADSCWSQTKNFSSLVYNRRLGYWRQAEKTKNSILCRYSSSLVGLCPENAINRWQYLNTTRQCYSLSGTNASFAGSINICQKVLTLDLMALPTPQSYKENEAIYYLVRRWAPVAKYVYLFYTGGESNCTNWMDGREMKYTNFVAGADTENCLNENMCIAMILAGRDSAKWDFIDCATSDKVGVLCTVPAQLK